MDRFYTQIRSDHGNNDYQFHISRKGSHSNPDNQYYYHHLVGHYIGLNTSKDKLTIIGKVIHEG